MSDSKRRKILSAVDPEDFIGRTQELDLLRRHAVGQSETAGLLLASPPAGGASETLKQNFDRIFHENGDLTPIYFAVRKSDKTARQCAVRFLQTFLQQTVASRRRDAKLLDFAGDLSELAEIALPSDGYWIDRLIENCRRENSLNDECGFLQTVLSAPQRAAAHDVKIFVVFDDLHETENLSGGDNFLEELKQIFSRSVVPFVLAGRRRFLSAKLPANYKTLQLNSLSRTDAGFLTERLAEKFAVKINEQTRDLITAQFEGKPAFVEFLFRAAAARKGNLDSFQAVEKCYVDELLAGKIGRFYDALISEILPNIETQKQFLGLLYDALTIETEKTPVESWKFRAGLHDAEFYRAVKNLNAHEIVRLSSNLIEAMPENEILSDYLKSRFRLEMLAEPRALVVAETLSGAIKRAPKTMTQLYRRNSAIGLRELLTAFDSQKIPRALLDYADFKDEYKGAPVEKILNDLEQSNGEMIELPQIVYAANTVAFYAPIEQIAEKERSAVAFGFERGIYTDEDETVWMAAEIDSKLEAAKDLTEFWCDRLEVAALMCDFRNYKIWLVAPEGFSPAALAVLNARNAYGSSRKQVNLLIKKLGAETGANIKLNPNEYEMIVPMGEDTELIAAQTVEEIARRHHFAPKAINQIKTALVEACINAAEHSHSPDRKIYQKFAVENDRLTVTVANRGLRFADGEAAEITPDEGRRGWGLKLMKTLMDEVKFEQTDDGTRISMTKYLTK